MLAERIVIAGASPSPVATTSQAHSIGDGSFLDALQGASTPLVPVTTANQVAAEPFKSKDVPHPFFEHQTWNPEVESGFFGEDGFDLGDLLDMINPLQHIPVVSSIYRNLTGDEISPAARLAGGMLYGGPVGLVSAFVSGVVEDAADTTLGDVIVAAFSDEDNTRSMIAADEMMRNQSEISESLSALLSARNQVPRGGSINGLSTYRLSPVMTQPVETAQLGQIPQTASFSAQPITSPAPSNTRNANAVPEPGKRGVPPLRTNIAANASPRRRAAASTPVPSSMVPKAMISALDKYETMVQQRQKPDADLMK
jgi:hypothetical protein